MQVRLAPDVAQPAGGVAAWHAFVDEFPEAVDLHCYLHTLRDQYPPEEEFTVSYGAEYHRT